jgi:class 3 adenylate cyclase
MRYSAPAREGAAPFALVVQEGEAGEQRFPFDLRIEIGRLDAGTPEAEGRLLVADPLVSSRHCVILQSEDGRLYVRDTSSNGTWLDSVRLIPNREQEIAAGQTLRIGAGVELCLFAAEHDPDDEVRPAQRGTLVQPRSQVLTVLVGDVRGYTSILTSVPGQELQSAVAGVFRRLARTIHSFGGQVKEYQGDSIMAFWEQASSRSPAVAACRAALALQQDVARMSADGSSWPFADEALRMDWAMATGDVSVQVLGADRPEELSLVGEAVVLAYRLEKAANDRTGSILTCARTRDEAAAWFEFHDLGALALSGFAAPVRAFCLLGEVNTRPGLMATGQVRIPGG